VLDYINRWRSLSLECKDRLSEASAVEMCAQGMEWDLLYVLQMSKPRTFQELATKAYDMEMTFASHYSKSSSLLDSRKDKDEFKKNPKSSSKEFIVASTREQVQSLESPSMKTKKLGSPRILERSVLHWRNYKRRNIPFLTRTCQECSTISFKMGLSSFQSQYDLKKLERLPTQSIADIIEWLANLLRNALRSMSILCNLPGMER